MVKRTSKWTFVFVLGLFIAVMMMVSQVAARAAWQQKVDDWVLDTAVAGQSTEFLIVLHEQADLTDLRQVSDKHTRGQLVYQRLTAVAQHTQAPIVTMLDVEGIAYRRYWVSNMIWARGDIAVVSRVAQRSDVAHIHANPKVQLDTVGKIQAATETAVAGPEWNIDKINAPAVWAEGITGEGVVIGGQDTGYDWTHPALQPHYRGWDGANADHNYNWHDAIHENNPNSSSPGNPCGFDLPQPCDDHGHGTHTMGTMVGDDGLGNQIGVAPGAKWIACRNMEQGWGSPASYSECYEWFIAPYPPGGDSFTDGDPTKAPHVINNSWSCPTSEGCTDPDILRTVVGNVRAAGIVTAHAASNAGSACSSMGTPAAIYDASFTVGATDNDDVIAGFSARGPVLLGDNSPAKPDISAPGLGIRSSFPGIGYGFSSGTSMAAPHVAGLTALLISANPALAGNVDMLEELMMETAVARTTLEGCGGDGPEDVPNHVYGWGRIDAWAAYEAAIMQEQPQTLFLPFLLHE